MKSILLIGTNRLGSLLVREFHKLGHQVMAVDKNEARINSVLPFVTDAQIGDSTSRPSSSCATGPTKSSAPKSRWQSGLPSVTHLTTFSIM